MNDVTVVTSVTYPSPESLALVADVQYHEPYLSAALNRKFRGIVDPGFYAGFLPKPGGGMNLLITSVDGDKTAGAASVDIGEFYQVTIQHRKDISLALNAGKKYAIVLKGRYLLGEDTYQVNTASHIHAAEFVARTYTDSYQLGDGELLVCTVNIPAGVSTITQEMIDTSERINRTIGIDISDSVTSTRSDVAASSLAVKKAYDLAKSKYTAQDASTTQKGLVQLSSETNSDSETMAATPKAVKSVKDLADTKAPIESPSLTGTPTAPTAAQGTNNTQIATTAYVRAAISALVGSSPEALDTLNELAEALGNDPNFATTMTNALAGKQPLDATLTALAGLPTGANKLPYFTGKDTVAQTDLTPVGRDILAKSSTQAIIQYLRLGAGAPPIGIPFFWPSAAMPNTVMDEWSDMVFLKFNGATFSASTYPKLALIFPGLMLPELRGEFLRVWDDGRGVDSGRALLSAQGDAIRNISGKLLGLMTTAGSQSTADEWVTGPFNAVYYGGAGQTTLSPGNRYDVSFAAARVVPTAEENRPRNIAFNFLVRAK